jgi:hypothetical protein
MRRVARRRAPHLELELRAKQGSVRNPQRPGLLTAANWLRSLFSAAPGQGEAFVTERGKVGRIIRVRMCGSCPKGMTECYDIEWHEDYLD